MDEDVKPKKKPKMIPIVILKSQPDSALVEFTHDGLLQRAYIPTAEIVDGKASEAVLDAGIPYGIDWESISFKSSNKDLANALRKKGIWTCEDAQRNTNVIVSALQAVYGVDLAALLKYAREQK